MTLNELYRSFLNELQKIYSSNEASNITSMIFDSIAGISKSELIKHPEKKLPHDIELKINDSLSQLMMHKPVQYIIGEAWFYKMKFKVSPAVLIPRPETEELVEEVISFLETKSAQKVIDIGTGSGCIVIAVKKNLTSADVTAIDISEQALLIAKENAMLHKAGIDFYNINFLEEKNRDQLGSFDAIISNPPYIRDDEKSKLDKNVRDHEPHVALFVKTDRPLIFYEKIADFGKSHLNEQGKIFMETHEDLGNDVAKLMKEKGYDAIIKKDLFGKDRMVIATRCP